ncbi:MAG: HNH endonuclease [Bacteroidales bacterium]|nr:HNH endonuclease [Bacteroidales bacterium]
MDRILELHSMGYGSNEIDRTMGQSHGQASKYLRLNGISPGKGITIKRKVECKKCGNVFETDNATRVYCDDCKGTGTYDHPITTCKTCGKEFEKLFRKHVYCSRECKKRAELKLEHMHVCVVCGQTFYDTHKGTKYCSDECRSFKPVSTVKCCWCGNEFETDRNGKRYCSKQCISKASGKRRAMRIRTQQPNVDDIPLRALYDRDGGICQICGKPTSWEDCSWNGDGIFLAGPTYPTHDHIVPLSKGGTHTWGNAQLAHFGCNTRKSAKLPDKIGVA